MSEADIFFERAKKSLFYAVNVSLKYILIPYRQELVPQGILSEEKMHHLSFVIKNFC